MPNPESQNSDYIDLTVQEDMDTGPSASEANL